jgi:hypothetical protein
LLRFGRVVMAICSPEPDGVIDRYIVKPSLDSVGAQTSAPKRLGFPSTWGVPKVHGQGAQLAPPQSTLASSRLRTESEQVGTWQMLPVHTWLAQSPGALQSLVSMHGPQLPPQSTSVSPWLWTPSAQVGAWHALSVHTRLIQSPALAQPLPSRHVAPQGPPQSALVSPAFCTPSLQIEAWQLPCRQTPLAHSTPTLHSGCDTHTGHAPPQSMRVSPPFWIPSEQVCDGHSPELQLPQLISASHAAASGQVRHTGTPQSGSVPPSLEVSPQIGPGRGPPASGESWPESGWFEVGGGDKPRSSGSVKPQRQCNAPNR